MPSFEPRLSFVLALLASALTATVATTAGAQQAAPGFALERFTPSAAGGGWFVMDTLDMHGGFSGATDLTAGYALHPLSLGGGPHPVQVVSEEAFANVGLSAGYDRYRLSLDVGGPILMHGNPGTVGGYAYNPPSLDAGSIPDLISDVRVGFQARLYGEPGDPLRLGAGAEVFAPNGNQSDYDSDGTVRAKVRGLFAGDLGVITYAGHVGVHVRPLDQTPIPGGPEGSELLFGVAAGPKVPLGALSLVVGPEVYGATALRSAFTSDATSLEWLMSTRLETPNDTAPRLRFKAGFGEGIHPSFGAPEWRVVFGFEVSDHVRPRAR